LQQDVPDSTASKNQKDKTVTEASGLLTHECTATKPPEASDDSNSTEDFINAEEVAGSREATIPPDNLITKYTTNSPAMRQSIGLQGVDDEMLHGLEQGHNKGRSVGKLRKASYGLCKSALCRFMIILPMMKELGLEQYGSDMCLFKHKENRALVVLYVDDLLISAEDDITIEAIAKELGERLHAHVCI